MGAGNEAILLANLANAAVALTQFTITFNQAISTLKQAQDEGRDVTDEEMAAALAANNESIEKLIATRDAMP